MNEMVILIAGMTADGKIVAIQVDETGQVQTVTG
jgi:hypothetical protein